MREHHVHFIIYALYVNRIQNIDTTHWSKLFLLAVLPVPSKSAEKSFLLCFSCVPCILNIVLCTQTLIH